MVATKTMATQREKAERFQTLHAGPGLFLIPNPWDAGSARVLEGLGFPALATSSSASAAVGGRRDGQLTRDEALAHARAIVEAVDLPVSADLEKGFSDLPEKVGETILQAAAVGLVGASIEDYSGDPERPRYRFHHAVDRVAAAAHAARSLPFPFTLTARCENFLHGFNDLDDTIARLKAYEEAGADVLFAPGLPSLDAVRAVCAAVSKPVNFIAAIPGKAYSVAELQAAGVRRISVGSAFYRAAMGGLVNAAREVLDAGTFSFLATTLTTANLNQLLRPGEP